MDFLLDATPVSLCAGFVSHEVQILLPRRERQPASLSQRTEVHVVLGERALRAQDRPAALRWFEMALAKEPDLERAPKVVIIKLKKLVHQTNSPIINCK